MAHRDLRVLVIDAVRELDRQGYLPGSTGNVSVRADDGAVLITPSGLAYADVEPDDLILVDLDGNQLEGGLKPSTETPMHTGIYRLAWTWRASCTPIPGSAPCWRVWATGSRRCTTCS